jgi:hypothetical protein
MFKRLKESWARVNSDLPSKKEGVILELGPDANGAPVDTYFGKFRRSELGRAKRYMRALISSTFATEYDDDLDKAGNKTVKRRVYTQGLVDQALETVADRRIKTPIREGFTDRVVLAQVMHPFFNGPDSLDERIYLSREELASYINSNDDVEVVFLEDMPEHRAMIGYLEEHSQKGDKIFTPHTDLNVPDFTDAEEFEYSKLILQALLVAYEKNGDLKTLVDRIAPGSADRPTYTLAEMSFRLADHLIRMNIQSGAERQKKYNELLTAIITGQTEEKMDKRKKKVLKPSIDLKSEMPELYDFIQTKDPSPTRFIRIKPYGTYADAVRHRRNARSRWTLRIGAPVLALASGLGWNTYHNHLEEEAEIARAAAFEAEYVANLEAATKRNAEESFRGWAVALSRWDNWRTTPGREDEGVLYDAKDFAKALHERYPELEFVSELELEQEFLAFIKLLEPDLRRKVLGAMSVDHRVKTDVVDHFYANKFFVYSARNREVGTEPNRPYHHILDRIREDGDLVFDSARFDPYSHEDVEYLGRFHSTDPDGLGCYELGLAPSEWVLNFDQLPISSHASRIYNDDEKLVVARECNDRMETSYFGAMGSLGVHELIEVIDRWEVTPYLSYIHEYCAVSMYDETLVINPDRLEARPHMNLQSFNAGPEEIYGMKVVSVDMPMYGGSRSRPILFAWRLNFDGPEDRGLSVHRTARLIEEQGWCEMYNTVDTKEIVNPDGSTRSSITNRPMDHGQWDLRSTQEEWEKRHRWDKHSPAVANDVSKDSAN